MVIEGPWPGSWSTTTPLAASKLGPQTAPAAQQAAMHGNAMTVPYAAVAGPNGSFLHAAIAALRTIEAGEAATARPRPARGGDKAADNPLRQPTVVHGVLVAPTAVVPQRRQGKRRRRDTTPNHREPNRC